MLLAESDSVLENESVYFDIDKNTITFKRDKVVITLTELQGRLIFILLTGVTSKRDIIRMVWQDNHVSITDNNYHQLIYQCRALFNRHGIPSHVLKTIPRHGAKFNYSALGDDENPVETTTDEAKKESKLVSALTRKQIHWGLFFLVMSSLTFYEMIS
ncbi:MAG: winged helix-turn-helix domain-containing protein [Serratia sp. (in: enterobacteria)]|uniref:winged helix-turn-helix domain-containing protein n=1 Tax=Serratia sp. (in: enterobacteria) TaxID=616 RepID=UPI003F2B215F